MIISAPFLFSRLFRVEIRFRHFHFRARRQNTHRAHEVRGFNLLHKLDDVTRNAATEAVIELLGFIDCKGRGPLVVEGTARPMGVPLFIERGLARDDFHNIMFRFQFLHELCVHAAGNAHTVTPPKENVEGMNKLSNTLIA